MQIDETGEMLKAVGPIDESIEPDSNAMRKRDGHMQCGDSISRLTDQGMQMRASMSGCANESSVRLISCTSTTPPATETTLRGNPHRPILDGQTQTAYDPSGL
jgi:hypothetical protein